MLSRWPIRKKLVLCLGLLLVMVGTLGWGGIYGLYAYRSLVRSLGRRVPELPLADALSQRVGDLRGSLGDDAFLVPDEQGQRVPYHTNTPLVRYARQEFEASLANVKICLDQYRQQLLFNPDHAGQIGDSRQEKETVAEIDALLTRIDATIRDQNWLLDEPKRGALNKELEQLQHLAGQLPTHLYNKIGESTVEARRQYRTLLTLIWTISGAAGLLLGLFVHLFYRWVFRPLRILINGSRKVAQQGRFDYRIRLQTHDEMSELAGAMNEMTARFQAVRDDLDRQVQERTEQVVRSEQLASVGFLAAGVAHEINNPLASIAMCAESLEGRIEPLLAADSQHDVVRNYLQMIQSEAFRCKGITEKLLDFSRMGEVKRQPTELGELVEGMIEMVRHLGKYQDKNIEFAPAERVVVSANPQELKQVVLNLLANGLDSLEAGGAVKITLRRSGNEAELTFTDNGCGMTEEVLEHLFEPFFTRRRGGQGTGLGLSIVYRIVSDHEGTIEVRSDGPNRGSTFRVCLPLASSAVQTQEKPYRHQAA